MLKTREALVAARNGLMDALNNLPEGSDAAKFIAEQLTAVEKTLKSPDTHIRRAYERLGLPFPDASGEDWPEPAANYISTRRDYFAAAVVTGLMATSNFEHNTIVEMAFKAADEMLKY